jgi:hypothetical protein
MIPLALLVAVGASYMAVTEREARLVSVMAALGGLGPAITCWRIVATGRASKAMEQDAVDALRGQPLPPER